MSIKADLKLSYDQCSQWNTDDVIDWLRKIQLSEAESYFQIELIDGLSLIQLSRARVEKIKALSRAKKEHLLKYLTEFERDQEKQRKSVKIPTVNSKSNFKHSLTEPVEAWPSSTAAAESDNSDTFVAVAVKDKPGLKNDRSCTTPERTEDWSDESEYEVVGHSVRILIDQPQTCPLPPPVKPAKPSPSNGTDGTSVLPRAKVDKRLRSRAAPGMTEPGDFMSDDSFSCDEEEYLNVDEVIQQGTVAENDPPPIPTRQRVTNTAYPHGQPHSLPMREPIAVRAPIITSYPSLSSPEEATCDSLDEKYEVPFDVSQRNSASVVADDESFDAQDIYEEPPDIESSHQQQPPPQQNSTFSRLKKMVPTPPSIQEQKKVPPAPSNSRPPQRLPQPPLVFQGPAQPRNNLSPAPDMGRRGSADRGKQPPALPDPRSEKPSLPPRLPHQQQPVQDRQQNWSRQQNQEPGQQEEDGECIYVVEDPVTPEGGEPGEMVEEVYDEVSHDETGNERNTSNVSVSVSVSRNSSINKQASGGQTRPGPSLAEKSNIDSPLKLKLGTDTLRIQLNSLKQQLKPTGAPTFPSNVFGTDDSSSTVQPKPFVNPPQTKPSQSTLQGSSRPSQNIPQIPSKPLPAASKLLPSNSLQSSRNNLSNSTAMKESSVPETSVPKWGSAITPKRHLASSSESVKTATLRLEPTAAGENPDRASNSSSGSQSSDVSASDPPQEKKKSQAIPKPPVVLSSSLTVPPAQSLGPVSPASRLKTSSVNPSVTVLAAPAEREIEAQPEAEDPLSKYSWYCGELGREIAKKRVLESGKDGAFLVRKSVKGGTNEPYTLCLLYKSEIYNIHLRRREDNKFALGKMKLEELKFDSAEDLIKFYSNNPLKLFKNDKQSGEVVLDRTIQL